MKAAGRVLGLLKPAVGVNAVAWGGLTALALHKEADYLVYLPAGYRAKRPLPVFYMLHEDSEWANTPSGNYESYVTNVVSDVAQRFATLPCRQERALAGLSAGAYGAANIGLHQDDMFGLVQVWSGYFIETHKGVFAHASRAIMRYNSPLYFVRTMRQTFKQYPQRLFLYVGRDDSDSPQTPRMAAALKAEGADATWAIYPGGHSWKTWTPHIDEMLEMASHDFAHPLGGASAKCT